MSFWEDVYRRPFVVVNALPRSLRIVSKKENSNSSIRSITSVIKYTRMKAFYRRCYSRQSFCDLRLFYALDSMTIRGPLGWTDMCASTSSGTVSFWSSKARSRSTPIIAEDKGTEPWHWRPRTWCCRVWQRSRSSNGVRVLGLHTVVFSEMPWRHTCV